MFVGKWQCHACGHALTCALTSIRGKTSQSARPGSLKTRMPKAGPQRAHSGGATAGGWQGHGSGHGVALPYTAALQLAHCRPRYGPVRPRPYVAERARRVHSAASKPRSVISVTEHSTVRHAMSEPGCLHPQRSKSPTPSMAPTRSTRSIAGARASSCSGCRFRCHGARWVLVHGGTHGHVGTRGFLKVTDTGTLRTRAQASVPTAVPPRSPTYPPSPHRIPNSLTYLDHASHPHLRSH